MSADIFHLHRKDICAYGQEFSSMDKEKVPGQTSVHGTDKTHIFGYPIDFPSNFLDDV
jgi:hypothetical protein